MQTRDYTSPSAHITQLIVHPHAVYHLFSEILSPQPRKSTAIIHHPPTLQKPLLQLSTLLQYIEVRFNFFPPHAAD